MKKIFINTDNQLRNGWWILIFIGFVALTRPIYKPIKNALSDIGFTETLLEPTSFLLILLATWCCLLLRKESLANVGFRFNLRWFNQILIGSGVGIAMLLATVALIWIVGGVQFELTPERNLHTLTYGLYLLLIGSLFEEILHRGFIFQRLIDGLGTWGAQILIGLLFAFGHLGNPGMDGITQTIASIELFLLSLVLGLAYIKTHSLALPIGLHLGWNWVQGYVLGFSVSGHENTGWFKPVFQDSPVWLTGDKFGPEASIFSIVISLVTFIILWRWQGTVESKVTPATLTTPQTA